MINTNIFQTFEPISLDEINAVKLMNRIDSKYLLSLDVLNLILMDIAPEYFILEINNKRIMPYESLYYDTVDNAMYLSHHNGKLNRYKIRYRKYLTNNESFLEVKYKHKGVRTIKRRIEVNNIEQSISKSAAQYLVQTVPYLPEKLEPKIYTNFSRITLVNRSFSERVTIDLDLLFYFNGKNKFQIKNTAVLETKKDGSIGNSLLKEILYKYGVYPTGMSKYCIGRALLEDNLKSNRFKERLLILNKIENGKHYYRNTPFT